ncbi:MAG: alkylmercury lyase [Mycobacteriales bacterium]
MVRIELLLAPDCPHAAAARDVLSNCLDQFGIEVMVVEHVGDYPSPTVLVNGVDVMNGTVGARQGQMCRLDPPTPSRVLAALEGQQRSPRAC